MAATEPPPLILLLGGSGYIGTHLMLELHGKPYQVAIIADKLPRHDAVAYAERQASGLPVLIYQRDILKNDLVSASPSLPPRVPYCAIMLAALRSVSEAEENPHEYMRVNTTLCVNSMQYLSQVGVKRIIQASSAAVYHTQFDGVFNEDCDYGNPRGVYGYTKYITEHMVIRLASQEQQVVILRYMNPIGSHPDLNIFSEIGICAVLSSAAPRGRVLINRGNAVRDYIHITDLTKFHARLLEVWDDLTTFPQIFNVGTGIGTSVSELIQEFNKTVPGLNECCSWVLGQLPDYEAYSTVASMRKASMMLAGWRPQKLLPEALEDYRRLLTVRHTAKGLTPLLL